MSDASPSSTQRRHGWLAGILALLAPGLGHLYVGRRGLALILSVLPSLIILSGVFYLFGTFAGTFAVAVATVLFYVASIAHAWRAAALGVDQKDAPRWFEYVVYLAAVLVIVSVHRDLATQPDRGTPTGFRYRPFKVVSHSMLPNLVPGDYFAVEVGPVAPSRGQVVVYRRRDDPNTLYIHRVVALAGDTIELTGGQLKVNDTVVQQRRLCPLVEASDDVESGEIVAEGNSGNARIILSLASVGAGPDLSPMVVPDGEVIVLGDFRANAADSRRIGTVSVADIFGVPLYVFWSSDVSRFAADLTTVTKSDEARVCAAKLYLFD